MVEDVPEFELSDAESLVEWIERVAAVHEHRIVQLTYIFCSDEYLHHSTSSTSTTTPSPTSSRSIIPTTPTSSRATSSSAWSGCAKTPRTWA
ncbi:hypothetical protein ACFQT0_03975 [Hymenobacter humi]|uniref:Uncharacterized protein n=1 Tax=Hymenobacter humi TaxID=1411620 RepID=A0ABW2U202_9BACT